MGSDRAERRGGGSKMKWNIEVGVDKVKKMSMLRQSSGIKSEKRLYYHNPHTNSN